MTNIEFANGLREIADFYEANPGFPQFSPRVHVWSKAEFVNAFSLLRQGGPVRKDFKDNSEYALVSILRDFGQVELGVVTTKDATCRKIVRWECPDSLLQEELNAIEAQTATAHE